MARTPRAPWKRSNPRKRAHKAATHLSPAEKSAAKARAKRAGRHYPNLVDNMRMAAKKATKKAKKTKTSGKKRAAKKSSTKKSSAKKASTKKSAKTSASSARKRAASKSRTTKARAARASASAAAKRSHPLEKDPQGGLTAAGRKAFAKRDGAHLKPGVTKKASEMTPQDMRRKGSWALRFYGRKTMPALVDAHGQPTRHALSAHAWGEPVPKTVAAARRIADKGERLLARYHRIKDKR